MEYSLCHDKTHELTKVLSESGVFLKPNEQQIVYQFLVKFLEEYKSK
jgi:hypothetical protein